MTDKWTMDIRGREVEVWCEIASDGIRAQFVADLDEDRFRHETWEGLRTGLLRATKRRAIQVEVPLLVMRNDYGGMTWVPAVATAFHVKTGKVMVRMPFGVEQFATHDGNVYRADVPVALQRARAEMSKRRRAVDDEIRGFDAKWQMKLGAAVEDAIQDVLDGTPE